jgi:hypothetical protein
LIKQKKIIPSKQLQAEYENLIHFSLTQQTKNTFQQKTGTPNSTKHPTGQSRQRPKHQNKQSLQQKKNCRNNTNKPKEGRKT